MVSPRSIILGRIEFLKTRPCSHCPFRSDRGFRLSRERAGAKRRRRRFGFSRTLLHDGFFRCHRAALEADRPRDIPCKGAAKFIENLTGDYRTNVCFRHSTKQIGTIGQSQRFAPDDTVPVYRSLEEFVNTTGV
jgi:hypothetical protein